MVFGGIVARGRFSPPARYGYLIAVEGSLGRRAYGCGIFVWGHRGRCRSWRGRWGREGVAFLILLRSWMRRLAAMAFVVVGGGGGVGAEDGGGSGGGDGDGGGVL